MSATPTGVTIDGILIDAGRINRREYSRLIMAIQKAAEIGDLDEMDEMTGELIEKIVVSWPFDAPISGYRDLSLPESLRVDRAITQFGQELTEKK